MSTSAYATDEPTPTSDERTLSFAAMRTNVAGCAAHVGWEAVERARSADLAAGGE